MDKKIKDYLHLYLGCEMVSKTNGEVVGKLLGVVGNEAHFKISGIMYSSHLFTYKPILRPLSDMTEEEAKKINIWGAWHDVNFMMPAWEDINWSFENFKDLLSKHFDLFGLIPEGLAIDATTLKK